MTHDEIPGQTHEPPHDIIYLQENGKSKNFEKYEQSV